MDRRERIFCPEEQARAAHESHQTRIWTALPGIVQSFDPAKNTCVVQPSIQGAVRTQDGSESAVSMPLLLDCPVLWQGGGGCTLTFPIKNGDECLVVFSSRCIDAWWQSGGVQPQAEFRMHDLSDGFALVGVRSLPRALSVSTSAAQLRTDDGAAYVQLNPTTHEVDVVTSGNIAATAGGNISIVVSGNASVTASGSAVVKAASIALQNTGAALKALLNSAFSTWAAGHVHSNGNGGGNTGGPTTAPPAGSQTSIVQAE